MNTNDLPPAAKLAALIEAGVAANPDIEHHRGLYRVIKEGRLVCCCSVTMATLGAGATRSEVVDACLTRDVTERRMRHLGISEQLLDEVSYANNRAQGFEEIIASLREGELAKVPA